MATGNRDKEVDELADQMSSGLKLIPGGQLLDMEELVYKASPEELNTIRMQVLQKQAWSGFDDEGLIKRILQATKPKNPDNGSGDNNQSYFNCFQNQIMLPTIVEKEEQLPSDIADEWLCTVCPEADRVLVVASHQSTRAYDLEGTWICEHDTHLPAGSPGDVSKVEDDGTCTILDCLYNDETQIYYVVDLLCWKGESYYKFETCERISKLREMMAALPSIKMISQSNPFRFFTLPFIESTGKEAICSSVNKVKFEITGLLFYHKRALYLPGLSPLGVWVETSYVPEVLGIPKERLEIRRESPVMNKHNWHKNRYDMSDEERSPRKSTSSSSSSVSSTSPRKGRHHHQNRNRGGGRGGGNRWNPEWYHMCERCGNTKVGDACFFCYGSYSGGGGGNYRDYRGGFGGGGGIGGGYGDCGGYGDGGGYGGMGAYHDMNFSPYQHLRQARPQQQSFYDNQFHRQLFTGGYGGGQLYSQPGYSQPNYNQRPRYQKQQQQQQQQRGGGRKGRKGGEAAAKKMQMAIPVPDNWPNWDPRERHEVMMSVMMEYIPENFENEYLAVICPIAKRRSVMSYLGWTCTYNKLLALDRKFQSSLPGGNLRSVQVIKSNDMCLLDCLHLKAERTFYILDLMHWKQLPYYQSEAEFRFHWINQIEDEMDLTTTHAENEYMFKAMPRIRCTQQDLYHALENTKFSVDGILFFHKKGYYVPGTSPAVLWLYPENIESVMGWSPPQGIIPRRKPLKGPTASRADPVAEVEAEAAVAEAAVAEAADNTRPIESGAGDNPATAQAQAAAT